MAISGRDRDPAFRRKKIAAKPVKKQVEKPQEKTDKNQNPVASASETKKVEQPQKPSPPTPPANKPNASDLLTTPVLEPQKKVEPAIVYEDDIKAAPAKSIETQKVQGSTEVKTPQNTKRSAANLEENKNKGAKKRRVLGIFMAIIFIVVIGSIGYYMMNNLMSKVNDKQLKTAATSDTDNASEDEGSPHAGAVNSNEFKDTEDSEELRETTLNDGNSLEKEMGDLNDEPNAEVTEQNPKTESNDEQEKQALSKVIRKKGDFEIPCWIVAFSANNNKPLANMNYSALEALGFDAGIYWIPKYFSEGKSLYKVYVGPYKTPEQAQAILPQIRNLQPDAYVMKIDE